MNFTTLSEAQIINIATPIMDNLMLASTQRNFDSHVVDFTARMRGIVTPEYFETVVEQYQKEKGLFAQRNLVAVFKRPDSAVLIWRQNFTQQDGDFVAEMVLVKQNGRYLCDHVMVF